MSGKISVIIPAYNAEKYLGEAIDSVAAALGGALPPAEIIVVSDGSTDGTAAVAAGKNAVLIEKERAGAAAARNAGLRAASGELIAFLDADDVLTPGALSDMYEFMLRTGADAVFARAEDFLSPELTEEERAGLAVRNGPYAGCLPGCSLIRRSVFDAVGPFDASLRSGETVQWMMKLKDSGLPTAALDRVTIRRRIHLTNTGRVARGQEMKNYAAILRMRNKRPSGQ